MRPAGPHAEMRSVLPRTGRTTRTTVAAARVVDGLNDRARAILAGRAQWRLPWSQSRDLKRASAFTRGDAGDGHGWSWQSPRRRQACCRRRGDGADAHHADVPDRGLHPRPWPCSRPWTGSPRTDPARERDRRLRAPHPSTCSATHRAGRDLSASARHCPRPHHGRLRRRVPTAARAERRTRRGRGPHTAREPARALQRRHGRGPGDGAGARPHRPHPVRDAARGPAPTRPGADRGHAARCGRPTGS